MRAIDVDKLKDLEELEYRYFSSSKIVPFYEADKVWEILEAAPTLTYDDLVPHGRWVDRYGGKYANPRYCCSECGEAALYEFKQNELGQWEEKQARSASCPHCGARMDGRTNNE